MIRSQEPVALTIGAFAAAGCVGVETVRFYQRKGLLGVPDGSGSVRRYGMEDVRRLRFIRQAQAAGFTLAEIGELLELDAGEDRARAHALAQARVAALDLRIAELQQARDALARLADRCGQGGAGPCPILASFEGHAPSDA
ncbi:MerR family mercuric resistance operon transcriptional regulator [Sphingomonas zeicaulis]|uniref:MerR family transcriptional regulator n=1 Tax=Sphingomonas zeicaulis TaxID=1632740 RepID=UPI003D207C49